ncbi:MAG: hypothetical protein IPQ07_01810 [Myxococcales bacterium]|nr:hypothetical protein [Myxococcales bacterium]
MDRGVIATAAELFEARHFPGVVAMCTDALESEPECVELMVIRARAHIGLRRELDAQADLREIIRLEPQCGIAYRLLGELAARRDENESAAIFFREAIRLDPDDQQARDWLQIVDVSLRPAAAARKFPAGSAAAAGRFPVTRAPVERGRSAGSPDGANRTLSAPARTEQRPGSQARFARGTRPPTEQDERPTKPFGRGSARNGDMWKTPTPHPIERTMDLAEGSAPTPAPTPILPTPLPLPPPPNMRAKEAAPYITIPGRPATQPPAPPTKIPAPRPLTRGPTPELPGFGEYLITAGIISRDRLRAAQAYQRSMKVHLSTAIVTLGLATPQRIEWAAVAHQSQLARERQQQP